MVLFTSSSPNPHLSDVTEIATIKNFNYRETLERYNYAALFVINHTRTNLLFFHVSNYKRYRELDISLPAKTRQNGTLYLHVVLADNRGTIQWANLQRDGPTVIQRVALTEFAVPKAATFNLLGETSDKHSKKPIGAKPTSHFKPKVFISVLTDEISMSRSDIPPELSGYVRYVALVSERYFFV